MSMIDALVDAQAQEAGWPKPEREVRFAPPRRWRADYYWQGLSIPPYPHAAALEIEGGVWTKGRHTRGSGFLKDCEKYNTMATMGIRLIRLNPQQVKNGELKEWLRRMVA